MTASSQTSTEAQDVGPFLRRLGEPLGNVPFLQELEQDDHDEEDREAADDQDAEVPPPERLLLLEIDRCHRAPVVSRRVGAPSSPERHVHPGELGVMGDEPSFLER